MSNLKDEFDEILQSFKYSAAGVRQAESNIAHLATQVSKVGVDLARALSSQAMAMHKMQSSIDDLNAHLQNGVGDSLGVLNDFRSGIAQFSDKMDSASRQMQQMSENVTTAIKTMNEFERIEKRASKNRDGTWTLEPIVRAR